MAKCKNKRVLFARKIEVELGRRLQKSEYRVAIAYMNGFSRKALAREIKKMPELQEFCIDRIANGIRLALIGNSDPELGEVYTGVISKTNYKIHSERHSREARKSNCIKQVKQRIGIHGLDREKLREFAVRSAKSKGLTVWSEQEKAYAVTRVNMYRNDRGICYRMLAEDINSAFHGGKQIRTEHSVKSTIRNYRLNSLQQVVSA